MMHTFSVCVNGMLQLSFSYFEQSTSLIKIKFIEGKEIISYNLVIIFFFIEHDKN
jgi:hypothetical protein